ncbi:hypothetical protein [Amycolatopsis sp. CA-128772]|uniref:hypothetical protein n=1 Tax=Amycolatopsis sp. CA-128772 TaxID=2073159 RepID=UPI000CD2DFC0|nr:hypothetical protein [Amycolatopsis sp. CA-128772]
MTAAHATLPSATFADTEAALQSHSGLNSEHVPQFGNTVLWDLNGVLRRPANVSAGAWKLVFSGPLTDPSWNLVARELCMMMFNPRHPALIEAGLSLKPKPAHPSTAIRALSHLRRLAYCTNKNRLTAELATWTSSDVRRCVEALVDDQVSMTSETSGDDLDVATGLTESEIRAFLGTLQRLHHYRDALTCGGLLEDPCHGKSACQAARATAAVPNSSTQAIPP